MASSTTLPSPPMEMISKTLGKADLSLLVILTALSVIVGTCVAVRGNKMKTTREFLTGGRAMSPVPVTLSLLGGVVSALSILGNATEMYLHGTQLVMNLLGCVWGVFIITNIILPVLYPLDLVSIFQYLQMRFSSSILKKMSSLTQIANIFFYLGVCLYAPSLTLSSVTDIPAWISIVFMGIACSAYIAIGGVRAVVYTDVLQTSLMFLGVLAVTITATIEAGGFSGVWSIAEKGKRLEFFNFDPSPLVRHSFWSVQVLGTYFIVSVVAFTQSQYQRLVSVRSLRSSIWLCYIFLVGLVMLWMLLYYCGVVAYASYAGCDPITLGQIEKPDEIIPYLVMDKFSKLPGLAGVFVAAVYGGVLSSISSHASASSTIIWEDFLVERKYFAQMSNHSATIAIKVLSALCGLTSIGFAFLFSNLGTLFQVAYTVSGAIAGPLDGLFITAIIAPWVTTKGTQKTQRRGIAYVVRHCVNEPSGGLAVVLTMKGAVCGFVGSAMFSMFLITGKMSYGAGTSETLPLSIENCPFETFDQDSLGMINNETVASGLIGLTSNATTVFSNTTSDISTDSTYTREYWAIFDLSYCYQGSLGILLTFTLSSIASIVTGVNQPQDVDPRLVHPKCLRLYTRFWDWCHKSASAGPASLEDNLAQLELEARPQQPFLATGSQEREERSLAEERS